MEMQIERSEKKGFLGRQRYVSRVSVAFTETERDYFKRGSLKNFALYDYQRDGGPQGTTGYYDQMPLFMFLDGPVPIETGDPALSKLIEDAIIRNLKDLKGRFELEGDFDGSKTVIDLG